MSLTKFLLPLLAVAGMSTALAQTMPGLPGMGGPSGGAPQKAPPVKKFQGVCYPPESQLYKRITDSFIPFVGMIDCLKSGGVAAKR
jgi:hypothetical protein